MTIGICEDDDDLRSVLTRTLRDEAFEVRPTATGREAVQTFTAEPPDLLVLDIGLPDADGRDVCQALRAHGVEAPVLFLTARGQLTDRLSGFHAGGDDYLTKPFALAELVVRVARAAAAHRRRGPRARVGRRAAAGSRQARRVRRRRDGGADADGVPADGGARRRGPATVLRRRELVLAAWPDGAIVHDNTLDAYIARLRRKLRELGATEEIATVRGVGYVLR